LNLDLQNKSVLITGASQGIGKAIAKSMAHEGCELFLVARDAKVLADLAEEIKAEFGVKVHIHPTDLSQAGAAKNLALACAGVDILINNAGNTPRGTIFEVDEDAWRAGWELKIFGYINLTREIYRQMFARQAGVIVNVIGIGAEKLEYGYAAGSMGNASLVAFTKTLGSVSLEHGVRILGVSPGWVETEKAKRTLKRRAQDELGDESRWPEMTRHMPRGQLIQPKEVADVVTFVASPKASAISGQIVTVDAGFSSRGYPAPNVKV
jgi:NAD(P)-dependent dehydrogenase (short-subunit alcohol dehydrogenase family)